MKKKTKKTLRQQSLLLNDTDITSDDEDHIYTRIPNLTPPSYLTQHYKQKTTLLSTSRLLTPHKKMFLQ